MIRKSMFAILLLLLSIPVVAAEFETLDFDTFVDPGLLSDPSPILFLSSRLYTGYEINYQSRNEFLDADSLVVRSANNIYLAPFQVTLDVTTRQPFGARTSSDRDLIPRFKNRIEFSWYHELRPLEASDDNWVTKSVILPGWTRFQVGWNTEERRSRGYVQELTVEFEGLFLPAGKLSEISFLKSYSGGYLYAWKPELSEHFAGYIGRYEVYRWRSGSNLKLGFGIGGEGRNNGWNLGPLRTETSLEIANLGRFGNLNLAYVLNKDLNAHLWHHQAGLVLNIPLYSKGFSYR